VEENVGYEENKEKRVQNKIGSEGGKGRKKGVPKKA